MNAICRKTTLVAAGLFFIAFGPLGCGHGSGSSVDADSSEILSRADREAREAAMAELLRVVPGGAEPLRSAPEERAPSKRS